MNYARLCSRPFNWWPSRLLNVFFRKPLAEDGGDGGSGSSSRLGARFFASQKAVVECVWRRRRRHRRRRCPDICALLASATVIDRSEAAGEESVPPA